MKRSNVAMHAALTFFFQILLVFMVFQELVSNCSYYSVLT